MDLKLFVWYGSFWGDGLALAIAFTKEEAIELIMPESRVDWQNRPYKQKLHEESPDVFELTSKFGEMYS